MRSLRLAICLAVLQNTAFSNDWFRGDPCDASCVPQQQYRPPQQCYQQCCPRPTAEPQAGPPEEYYVAPPVTGEYQGASESTGIRFGSIRIPEITIPFPTFQLPSFQKFHREPQLQTDRMTAGLQAGPVLDTQIARPRADEQAGPPESAEPQAGEPDCMQPVWQCPCDRCAQLRNGPEGRIKGLEQQISQLQGLVEQIAMMQMQRESIQQSGFQSSTQRPVAPAADSSPVAPVPTSPAARPLFEFIEDTTPFPGGRPMADPAAQRQIEAQRQAELQRQAEIERQTTEYHQKCQEAEQLRAQVAEMQRQYQLVLEMQQNEVFRQREDRLRNQLTEQPTATARPAQPSVQPRPMPGGLSAPLHPRERASESVFEQSLDAQAAYRWQIQPEPAQSGVARLSNLGR